MPPKFTPNWPEIIPIIIALGAFGFFAFVRVPWWVVIIFVLMGYFSSRDMLVVIADKSQPQWAKTGAFIAALVSVGLCAASEAPWYVLIFVALGGYFVFWYALVIFSKEDRF